MTTNKLTDELVKDSEIQMLIDSHEKGTAMFMRVDAYYLMAKELQERRKAAMDSEPVAVIDQANLDYLRSGADADVWPPEREEMGDVLLYRHAQPATVNAEIRWRSEECECVAMCLDEIGVPKNDENGDLSLWGRVVRYGLMLQAGNSPVIPDRWIPVSERMPEGSEEVLCTKEFDGPGDWRKKVGYWLAGKWIVYGASWEPTHWMPLPEPPHRR